ncbi:MAG: HEPN domain-containing protein [Methanoregulaceae archaeon]
MTKLDECFEEGKLQPVLPSEKKAHDSLCAARENLHEAETAAKNGIVRAATNSVYVAIFHGARAVLFHDGIREKSHFCLEQYLNTFVVSGALERKWIMFFADMRSKRDINQYGFEPPLTRDEVATFLDMAARFIDEMEQLITMKKMR